MTPGQESTPVHTASLSFSYDDRRRARTVERAVAVEVGEIPGADGDPSASDGMAGRSRAAVSREGRVVSVEIEAADLVALRAGANTWTRLISVAESVADRAE